MALLDICVRPLSALYTIEEIANVSAIEIPAFLFDPIHGRFPLRRSAGRNPFRGYLKASAQESESALGAIDIQRKRLTRTNLAYRPRDDDFRELIGDLLDIRRFTAISQRITASNARDCGWPVSIHDPACDIQMVGTPIRHLAARVVPEPAKIIDATERVKGPPGSGAQPHFPIKRRSQPR